MDRISLTMFALALLAGQVAVAADIDECRSSLISGDYETGLKLATEALEKGVYGESWHLLKADAEIQLGRYETAFETLTNALENYGWSIRLRWRAIQAGRFAGQEGVADKYAPEIAKLVQSTPWRYTDAENLVTLAEFALDQGADAKEVQDTFLQRAKRNNPVHRSPVLALGQLALDKRDFQLAYDVFKEAADKFPEDPDVLFGVAQASSDPQEIEQFISLTFQNAPKHIPATLYQVNNLLDGEQYDQALPLLERTLEINPHHAEALAWSAAIAFLQGDEEKTKLLRDQALSTWKENPEVDHIIGRELSQKYRFQEGSEYQRKALELQPDFLPAKKQLANDLLRLGKEEEGWKLADEVYQQDQYDVSIYNLVTLRDELEKFTTLERDGFIVRMDSFEARTYGDRVLDLLAESRQQLVKKYEIELPEKILVEIFPRPSDFAVRTFGMPAAGGYLGVCFGDVITANSPASQDNSPTNWQSVLWHEFAHVVTLNKTHNRMPRWLSEGISVYEERQRDPSWGEQMNIAYRNMILEGELTPIGELSNAFISPKSPMHLQFAYFQCSLVVEHIIDVYGFEALLKILDDLAVGITINEAIERHTAPLLQIDEEFQLKTLELANEFGKEVDWSKPDLEAIIASELAITRLIAWVQQNPNNYVGLKSCGDVLVRLEADDAAADAYQQAIKIFPYETGSDSPYVSLAKVYQRQGKIDEEYDVLLEFADLDDDSASTFLRLAEIELERKNWEPAREFALKMMAVKPIVAAPHTVLARAAEELKRPKDAIAALSALLEMDPSDPADLHFRLAQQLKATGDQKQAKRHTLQALEEAPRYREALRLLLQLADTEQGSGRAEGQESKGGF